MWSNRTLHPTAWRFLQKPEILPEVNVLLHPQQKKRVKETREAHVWRRRKRRACTLDITPEQIRQENRWYSSTSVRVSVFGAGVLVRVWRRFSAPACRERAQKRQKHFYSSAEAPDESPSCSVHFHRLWPTSSFSWETIICLDYLVTPPYALKWLVSMLWPFFSSISDNFTVRKMVKSTKRLLYYVTISDNTKHLIYVSIYSKENSHIDGVWVRFDPVI